MWGTHAVLVSCVLATHVHQMEISMNSETGTIRELINKLNGVEHTDTYEYLRRLCRNAAQTIEQLKNKLEEIEQQQTYDQE